MSLTDAELTEILSEMNRVAGAAGARLDEGCERPKSISYKGEVDLVTQYDTETEDLIRESLGKSFPGIGFVAEESNQDGQPAPHTCFIVDPLDGTTNFAHGYPIFAVSIGLRENQKLVAGTICIPRLGEIYSARRGGGAFCNGKPIRVSSTKSLNTSLLATGFPYDRRTSDDDNLRELRRFIKTTQGVRRAGAAAVDLAFVAKGLLDGFWEPKLHQWDIAAGTVLVREAGGRVTDYNGNQIDIEKGWIVASNGQIHRQMLHTIEEARRGLDASSAQEARRDLDA